MIEKAKNVPIFGSKQPKMGYFQQILRTKPKTLLPKPYVLVSFDLIKKACIAI